MEFYPRVYLFDRSAWCLWLWLKGFHFWTCTWPEFPWWQHSCHWDWRSMRKQGWRSYQRAGRHITTQLWTVPLGKKSYKNYSQKPQKDNLHLCTDCRDDNTAVIGIGNQWENRVGGDTKVRADICAYTPNYHIVDSDFWEACLSKIIVKNGHIPPKGLHCWTEHDPNSIHDNITVTGVGNQSMRKYGVAELPKCE